MNQLLAYLQPRASLSRLEDTVIRKLVGRLHQDSDTPDQVARVGEEVEPDTSTAATGRELMRVDAPALGEDAQTGNDKSTVHTAALQDEKKETKQPATQAVTASGKAIQQGPPWQTPNPSGKIAKQRPLLRNPYPSGDSIPLSDYVEGPDNEQPYQFGMKHMQKHGWSVGQGLGPQGKGIREFLQPVEIIEHGKQKTRTDLRPDEAPTADRGRNPQGPRDTIHKDTVAMPDGKRYEVTSTPRYTPNASIEYGEAEWQNGFQGDPYLKKYNTKHATWAHNGW